MLHCLRPIDSKNRIRYSKHRSLHTNEEYNKKSKFEDYERIADSRHSLRSNEEYDNDSMKLVEIKE